MFHVKQLWKLITYIDEKNRESCQVKRLMVDNQTSRLVHICKRVMFHVKHH